MIINSQERTIGNFLAGSFFAIPRFQRPYSWDKSNVEDFWNDVVDNGVGYFIGSMVIYPDANSSGVVDGQQRLTTMTIVLAALRNALISVGATEEATGLHTLIERIDPQGKKRYVLLTETSYPFLQKAIQNLQDESRSGGIAAGAEEQNLARAFQDITARLELMLRGIENDPAVSVTQKKRRKIGALTGLRDKVLGLTLVVIEVDDQDDATVVFQTLNSRGKDLEVADLVKSHVLSLIKAQNADLDEARDRWVAIVDSFDESAVDINMNRFLIHSWQSRVEYVSEKTLFRGLKTRVRSNNADGFLADLVEDAGLYRTALEPTYRPWKKPQFLVRESLKALNLFRLRQPLPMILSLLREYSRGSLSLKQLNRGLTLLENYHFVATAVTNQPSSGGVSFMYAASARALLNATNSTAKDRVISDLRKKLEPRLPSYAEFEASFLEIRSSRVYTQQAPLVRYILTKLHAAASARATTTPVDYDQLTVEHLAPQNAKRSAILNVSDIGRVGNLLLVTQELNEQLADQSFGQKVRLLRGQVGVDSKITRPKQWTSTEIEDRTKELAKLAYNRVWKL